MEVCIVFDEADHCCIAQAIARREDPPSTLHGHLFSYIFLSLYDVHDSDPFPTFWLFGHII